MTITEIVPRTGRTAERTSDAVPERPGQIEAKLGEVEALGREQANLLAHLVEGYAGHTRNERQMLDILKELRDLYVKALQPSVDRTDQACPPTADREPTPRRPARDGEVCACGRPAVDVLLFNDLGPTPSCGTFEEGRHRPAGCPSWCVAEHSRPWDGEHGGEIHEVELAYHPYVVTVLSGEEKTYLAPILASILTDSADGEPYISLVNHDGCASDRLTSDEADQLADILQELAATMRREEVRS
ncbi:DUF6907 domain-containing protein [Actinoallomurus acaciae]|uniref:DUF6907 domain-containing protein n=1 Tax=Actinoallomurus acaciae TaxID=502577 RepID=A0ABV5YI98_9ACTN